MCSFSTSVWKNIFLANGTIGNVASTLGRYIKAWWDDMLKGSVEGEEKGGQGCFIYAMWLGKSGTYKRFFRNIALVPDTVVALVRKKI
jgi:hypothetical protein